MMAAQGLDRLSPNGRGVEWLNAKTCEIANASRGLASRSLSVRAIWALAVKNTKPFTLRVSKRRPRLRQAQPER